MGLENNVGVKNVYSVIKVDSLNCIKVSLLLCFWPKWVNISSGLKEYSERGLVLISSNFFETFYDKLMG